MGNHIMSGQKWALESFQPWNGKSVSFQCQLQSFSDGCLKRWAEKRAAHLGALWGAEPRSISEAYHGQGSGETALGTD